MSHPYGDTMSEPGLLERVHEWGKIHVDLLYVEFEDGGHFKLWADRYALTIGYSVVAALVVRRFHRKHRR